MTQSALNHGLLGDDIQGPHAPLKILCSFLVERVIKIE